MKKTSLFDRHVAAGAKIVDFAGYQMPVRYTSLIEEHMAVREAVGIFDVSHMGEFVIKGGQALDLVQRVSSNDVSKIVDGQAMYSCFPNETGGIIDDFIVYRKNQNEFFLVVNASNIEKDWNWITKHNTFDASMEDLSETMSLLAVQGPKASALLQAHTDVVLDEIDYYHFKEGRLGNIENVIISATGYTGSGGFELYVKNEDAPALWDLLFADTNEIKALPAGLGARDTLRLEAGFCLYGNDIDDTTSPIEAGLSWITKFGHDFVNAAGLKSQKENGVKRKLVGFEVNERGIPRQGYDILSTNGQIIGKVTSGTMSPMLEKGIGLGYIDVPHHKKGTDILIQIRKKQVPATVKRPPFVTLK